MGKKESLSEMQKVERGSAPRRRLTSDSNVFDI